MLFHIPTTSTARSIAGPIGAGKSTSAATLLPGANLPEFVKSDTIARGLSEFHPESAALAAGCIMLEPRFSSHRRQELHLRNHLVQPDLRAQGHWIELIFCWLPSPEMCVARVVHRAGSRGHSIPRETIHRRYHAGLRNFFRLYLPLSDRRRFHDTSGAHRLIAGFQSKLSIIDTPLRNKLAAEYGG